MPSFSEQAVNVLYRSEYIVYAVTGVILLFYQVPAYKLFKTRALLLLIISEALGLFATVFDATIGQSGAPNPHDIYGYYLCREIVWWAAVILGTAGMLMFLRDYTRLASTARGDRTS